MAALDRIKSLFKRAEPQVKPEETKAAAKDVREKVSGTPESRAGAAGEQKGTGDA